MHTILRLKFYRDMKKPRLLGAEPGRKVFDTSQPGSEDYNISLDLSSVLG
jgi:hypothetical protein